MIGIVLLADLTSVYGELLPSSSILKVQPHSALQTISIDSTDQLEMAYLRG